MKSGADIKKRPVVKTELWPHTIANEENGDKDEVTSENINLSEFLTCFQYIVINAKSKVESAGRSVLLHAISTILKCLPWAEARNFHNIVMLKIEQNRLDWNSDFIKLGKEYLDNKVRLSLRTKNVSASSESSYRPSGRNYSRGASGSNSNRYNDLNRNKAVQSLICHQWNAGTCSFGVECRRWHTCKTCAEAGKIGQKHKAVSHDSSSGKPKPSDPQV